MNDEWRKETGIRWNPVSKKVANTGVPGNFIVQRSSFIVWKLRVANSGPFA
jgi:hypothetical protein